MTTYGIYVMKHHPHPKLPQQQVDATLVPSYQPIMTMIAPGQEQGMEIVAEEVETARQSQILIRSGIYLQQGVHFCRPMFVGKLPLVLDSN